MCILATGLLVMTNNMMKKNLTHCAYSELCKLLSDSACGRSNLSEPFCKHGLERALHHITNSALKIPCEQLDGKKVSFASPPDHLFNLTPRAASFSTQATLPGNIFISSTTFISSSSPRGGFPVSEGCRVSSEPPDVKRQVACIYRLSEEGKRAAHCWSYL